MKPIIGRFFADSNILLYLLSNVDQKKEIAKELLSLKPVISTQVITENINVAIKKFKTLSAGQIYLHKNTLLQYAEVVLIDESTIDIALDLKYKYNYQWFDCLIISAALQSNCDTLFTEDMQHDQSLERSLLSSILFFNTDDRKS